MDKYEAIENALCDELDDIGRKLESGTEMTTTDLDRVDKIVHALKSMATYKAMKESEEYEGMSGRNMRPGNNRSYSDGYSQGYYDAQSGHYPYMPMPRGGRGW